MQNNSNSSMGEGRRSGPGLEKLAGPPRMGCTSVHSGALRAKEGPARRRSGPRTDWGRTRRTPPAPGTACWTGRSSPAPRRWSAWSRRVSPPGPPRHGAQRGAYVVQGFMNLDTAMGCGGGGCVLVCRSAVGTQRSGVRGSANPRPAHQLQRRGVRGSGDIDGAKLGTKHFSGERLLGPPRTSLLKALDLATPLGSMTLTNVCVRVVPEDLKLLLLPTFSIKKNGKTRFLQSKALDPQNRGRPKLGSSNVFPCCHVRGSVT